jgi:hypothetical protein
VQKQNKWTRITGQLVKIKTIDNLLRVERTRSWEVLYSMLDGVDRSVAISEDDRSQFFIRTLWTLIECAIGTVSSQYRRQPFWKPEETTQNRRTCSLFAVWFLGPGFTEFKKVSLIIFYVSPRHKICGNRKINFHFLCLEKTSCLNSWRKEILCFLV